MFGSKKKKTKIMKKFVYKVDTTGQRTSVSLDVYAMLSLLSTQKLVLPMKVFIDQEAFYHVSYSIDVKSSRIPSVTGSFMVGKTKQILENVRGLKLALSSTPSHNEIFSRMVFMLAESVKRFPRSFIIVSQISPYTTLNILRHVHGKKISDFDKKLLEIDDRYLFFGRVTEWSNIRYGEYRILVDGKEVEEYEEEKESIEKYRYNAFFVIGVDDLVSLVMVGNAHTVSHIYGGSNYSEKSYIDLSRILGAKEESGK